MKKVFLSILLLFFITGCGNKVDDEALEDISKALEKRWAYADELPEEVTMEELEKAIQIELDELKEYGINDFENTTLYSRYGMYKSGLERMLVTMQTESIDSSNFQEQWDKHQEERAKILYDINSESELRISPENKETFEEILSSANRLVEIDEMKKVLSDISNLEDLDVEIKENSIAITFSTKSALSADSFVASKTGFPSDAVEMLKLIKKYKYENIVIATTNQDATAISSYFTKDSLNNIDFDGWDETDSLNAYKFYKYADAYHIRLGIWESLDTEVKRSIGEMNKNNSDVFWKEYGFTHDF